MTVDQALAIQSRLSKKKTWTIADRVAMRAASQVVRYNLRRKHNPPSAKAVVIYPRVLTVQAQKQGPHRCDAECKKCNHCYFHDFKPGAVMYGLPNGDILIRSKK